MKNISVILNVVLAIAVAILYYLHFSCSGSCSTDTELKEVVVDESKNAESQMEAEPLKSNVGYINVDSLQDKYALYEELIQKLKAKQTKYEREISTKMTAFEKKVQEFQKQAPSMSQFEGQMKQQELAEEEQKLYKLREDFAVKFQEEEIKLNDQFQKTVQEYIKKHNQEANFDIIIGASQIGNIVLDFKPGIDITNQVVEGLNNEYKVKNTTK
ncbi:MAG: OmpH family outer membrane protein [Flavobacteriales bacterium]|nr:OmpH family outer membrane protein [Flavobacteriales bacterium]